MSKQTKQEVPQKRISTKLHSVDIRTLWKDRNLAIPLIIILILTAVVYIHTFQNRILGWDDGWHITYNNDVQTFNVKNIFSSYYGNMYQPLTSLTFAVEYYLFGLTPFIYHATNVLFHLANVVLVFLFVFRLSNRREIAIIAACLFGIHPMHVESVAWITERKDVVYAFFYLYALICYIRFIQREGNKYYWLAFLSFILSLFSKTTAVTFPVVLFLIDIYLNRKIKAQTIIEKIPLFLLSIVFGYIALHSQSDSISYAYEKGIRLTDRFFLISYSVCYYIIHLFVPINLSALHLLPDKVNGLLPLEYYLAVIPFLALILLGIRKGIFRHEYIFGLLLFFITISLSVHIIPVGMAVVAERYAYIPYIGLYYIIGQFYCFVIDRYKDILLTRKKVIYASASLLVVLLGCITYQRIGVWETTLVLFHDATIKANNIKEANYIQSLGYECEAGEKNKERKYAEAIEWYDKALALDSISIESYTNRGIAKHCLKDYEGAMKDYTKAIELNPSMPRAYANRAAIYLVWNKRDAACADLRIAYNLGLYNVYEAMQVDCP